MKEDGQITHLDRKGKADRDRARRYRRGVSEISTPVHWPSHAVARNSVGPSTPGRLTHTLEQLESEVSLQPRQPASHYKKSKKTRETSIVCRRGASFSKRRTCKVRQEASHHKSLASISSEPFCWIQRKKYDEKGERRHTNHSKYSLSS